MKKERLYKHSNFEELINKGENYIEQYLHVSVKLSGAVLIRKEMQQA